MADCDTGRSLFAAGADLPLKPASVLKLFVTAAALERLGPGFQFRTPVYLHDGELWVTGAGDPGLGDARLVQRHGRPPGYPLTAWVEALRSRGISRIERLALDDRIFDGQGRHPDWPDSQANAWYQAPVGALNLNDNCLDVRIEYRAGTVELLLEPQLPPEFLVNLLRPGKTHRPVARRELDADVFEFAGTVARAADLGPVAAGRPTVFFGHALRQALQRGGIEAGDVVRRAIDPADAARAVLVAEHTTPLADVLWRCNTFSQNLFAECLVKALAAYGPEGARTGVPGSWEAGQAVVRQTLARLGIGLDGAVLRDGSGLSHQNRVTAAQVVAVLLAMERHRHRDVFLASLAAPGEDGSMRRFDNTLAGRLRGKTGTLSNVRTLAGYVTRPDGGRLAFAILCQGKCSPELPEQLARILATVPAAR